MITSHDTVGRRFFDWLFIRLSRNVTVDGLWIGVFMEDRGVEMLRRIGDALRLIKTYDPYRYKRVLRELDRIWVHLLPGNVAIFLSRLRRCVIDPRYALSYSTEHLASVIVHEATHGRLMRGNIGYPEELRHRIENVCVRQELAFSLKIPRGEELRQSIEQTGTPKVWTNEAFRKRERRGLLTMLRFAGLPKWLTRMLVRIYDRRAARLSTPKSG